MNKENFFDFSSPWYDLWMKQSQYFFASTEENLTKLFAQAKPIQPKNHLEEINAWLEVFKKQWACEEESYWQLMAKMYTEAANLLVKRWIKANQDEYAIQSIRELYELWLNCCHEVYQKLMQTPSYQEAYIDFMQKAFVAWKASVAKE